jgi:UDP-glucuronate 4-epimerase
MNILLTGIAGFIGMHTAKMLLEEGHTVIGIDNLNEYYDTSLKHARLKELDAYKEKLHFYQQDIADYEGMQKIAQSHTDITHVIHLAAQAGVRYSLEAPFSYGHSNLIGQLTILELCRNDLPALKHCVYASSSSVYGKSTQLPYSLNDRADSPVSLYAATKRSGELMAHSYSHLYNIPTTGLRFFTVYGPWGRPDMAYFMFTKSLLEEAPITVFGEGKLKRDFTYIDDITAGIRKSLDAIPTSDAGAPYQLFNLGNNKSASVSDLIAQVEHATDKKAIIEYTDMPAGDVRETHADISQSVSDLGFSPTTPLEKGIPAFVEWYKRYTKS